ncbi:MAG TPA: NAD(P)/FAD-dependent oxidoreductase [Candidatus Paceibacterota bacterium]
MRYEFIKADIAIIGAGAVGCALARRASMSYPNKKIVVIEKRHAPGQETSRLNSNVIHSGLHQKPDSLKALLARRGNKLIVDYALARRINTRQTGMIIAIPSHDLLSNPISKLASLTHLIRQGHKQNIKFEFLSKSGIKRYEPQISALAGIFIPNVWIIDIYQFMRSLYLDANSNGVNFLFHKEVTGIEKTSNGYQISANKLRVSSEIVINAAGLYADKIAAMAGFEYQTEFWRGEYYEVSLEKSNLIHRLVYPVTSTQSPSKGIHFSPRINGRLFIGPNAKLVPTRDYYNMDKTGADYFLETASRFCSRIRSSDLRWGYSGIRPKLKNWQKDSDFVINKDNDRPVFINLVGIDSPGLTASMAIAEKVMTMIS